MKKLFALLACTIVLGGAATPSSFLNGSRAKLLQTLRSNHVLVPGRRLLRLTYLCSVELGNQKYPIIDIFESVPGAMETKGIARLELLSPNLKPVQSIPYVPPTTPLFCKHNSVYFQGNVFVDQANDSGNEISFLFGGQGIAVHTVAANTLPAPMSK
ncbi:MULTISPECIES: hypothetical protein [Acidiphilium]|uniref:Uncharacterized protein n=1 Tax=Acidiphilium rubrum TaxID=526 RepID=A0A8G2CNT5_ACIRU|nr:MULTISPECIES: hypothetical protein [Acidiphilium]SIR49620.1 hypothetical protein SAMN05421828_14011 [Acidiphilium rubrum]